MNDIDFLPESIKRQRIRRRRLIRQGYLLGICLVGLAVLGYRWEGRISKAQAELSLLERRTVNVQQQLVLREELERQEGELLVKQRISEHLGSRINALDVLAALERALPETVSLVNLNLETIKVRVPVAPVKLKSPRPVAGNRQATERTIKRVRIVLTGVAPTDVAVANFIGRLSSSPVFEDVNMGYAKTVVFEKAVYIEGDKRPVFEKRAAREFQASCLVVR